MVHEAFTTVSEVRIHYEAITSIHRHLRKNPGKGRGSLGRLNCNCAENEDCNGEDRPKTE
jgi:hypothetical protein